MSEHEYIRVRDVMRHEFDIFNGLATVAEVLRDAQHLESKCIIVDKRHDYDEYGIVMLSDIAKKVVARNKSPERVNIYEIMSKPVVSVDPDMNIRYCARFFENLGISRAPVVEHGKVIGTVGYTNIVLRGLSSKLEDID